MERYKMTQNEKDYMMLGVYVGVSIMTMIITLL